MWKVLVDEKEVFCNECQRECVRHLIDKNYYADEKHSITYTTDRNEKQITVETKSLQQIR